jgi:hypothetical protein
LKALAVVAALAILAVGCGGAARLSKAAYQTKLDATSRVMTQSSYANLDSPYVSLWTVGSPPARRAARRLTSTFDGLADGLARLRPPNDVEADNRALVAGLRALAGSSALWLEGGFAKAYAAEVAHPSVIRGFNSARKDLEAKGYTFERRRGGGAVVYASEEAKEAKPFPFALISASGRQPAVDLEALSCPLLHIDQSCGDVPYSEPASGPRPGGLSVVRPGEKIRFTTARVTDLTVLNVRKICSGALGKSRLIILPSPSWKVSLPWGRYVATVSFSWSMSKGAGNENGIVGLLVSTSAPLRVLPTPSCGAARSHKPPSST